MIYERLKQAIESDERCVLMTVLEGPSIGRKLLVLASGKTIGDGPPELAALAADVMHQGRNRVLELENAVHVFAEVLGPPPRLLVYGATDTAECLCRMAAMLGWRTIVADAREKLTTRERLPSAGELVIAWPEDALAQVSPDEQTAIVVLTHEDKFDVPMLLGALATDAFYVGALGSRRNQERRRRQLLEAGAEERALERISGPCGLDLGASSQPETALSVLAEIVAVRAGRSGGRLRDAESRIHAEV